MAKRSPQSEVLESRKFSSQDEIDNAIRKLERRENDIVALHNDGVSYHDARVGNVERAIRDTVRDIFGANSPEFRDHEYFRIDRSSRKYLDEGFDFYQQRFLSAIEDARTRVRGLLDRLLEQREDLDAPSAAPRIAFAHRSFNPAVITDQVVALYRDRHYEQAVFEAAKMLVTAVREISDRTDLDGAPLMEQVFSPKNPIIAFNQRGDSSDDDEQRGMMHLFQGAVLAIRNPRAHRSGYPDSAERALQYLDLLNLLADRLLDSYKIR
jgi:uncharacterized protein (TIGR02391 family)